MPLTLKLVKYSTELRNTRGWKVLPAKDVIHLSWKARANQQRGGWLSNSSLHSHGLSLDSTSSARSLLCPPHLAEFRAWDLTSAPVGCLQGGWCWPEKQLHSPPDEWHQIFIIQNFGTLSLRFAACKKPTLLPTTILRKYMGEVVKNISFGRKADI